MTKSISFYFISWIFIGVLISSAVASSFVICDHGETNSKVAQSISKAQLQGSSIENSANNALSMDSCSQGICHFGRCASLTLPIVYGFNFSVNIVFHYFLKITNPPDRSLDSPFQPPKTT